MIFVRPARGEVTEGIGKWWRGRVRSHMSVWSCYKRGVDENRVGWRPT